MAWQGKGRLGIASQHNASLHRATQPNCECRDTLTDLIETGTQAESDNARCWLEHYLTCHDAQGCNGEPPNCPDDDPCGKH